MSTESRLSIESPCLRRRWPMPPCSVRPAMPVVETTPPGTARPKSCVSRSTSPQVAPPSRPHRRGAGSTWTPRICERSIDQAAVVHRVAGDVVAAALDREQQVCSRAKLTASTTSAAPGALHDQRRPAVDQPVPDRPRIVVTLIARTHDRSPQTIHKALSRLRAKRHLRACARKFACRRPRVQDQLRQILESPTSGWAGSGHLPWPERRHP